MFNQPRPINISDINRRFKKENVLALIKSFLDRHGIPSTIVNDVEFHGYFEISVNLTKGSIKQYGNLMKAAFDSLPSSKNTYDLISSEWVQDYIQCWEPFIKDIEKAITTNEFEPSISFK